MKNKMKLSRMEKFALWEYEAGTDAVNRFLHEETTSIPCGNSPGAFISELLQTSGFKDETDPFSHYMATEDNLMDAQRIFHLSSLKDSGACVIMLAQRTCDINGKHLTFPNVAFIQIRTKPANIYCSLLLNFEDTFAADILVDSYSDICFMMIEAADIGRIYVPLNEFRFLAINRNKKSWENAGYIVEYEEFLKPGIQDHIIFGDTLDRVIRETGMDGCKDRHTHKPVRH